mmetsp:Transcript_30406/g.78642  ORF Transcript_30406/g.78642 Transcript_30406/m.78642 type:complete len:99 (-) Transcript_30406:1093-1389(-)
MLVLVPLPLSLHSSLPPSLIDYYRAYFFYTAYLIHDDESLWNEIFWCTCVHYNFSNHTYFSSMAINAPHTQTRYTHVKNCSPTHARKHSLSKENTQTA